MNKQSGLPHYGGKVWVTHEQGLGDGKAWVSEGSDSLGCYSCSWLTCHLNTHHSEWSHLNQSPPRKAVALLFGYKRGGGKKWGSNSFPFLSSHYNFVSFEVIYKA